MAVLVAPRPGLGAGQVDECADAYELAQSEQQAARPLEARTAARVCAAKCPDSLATDCTEWDSQATAQIASFIVHARGIDGAPLAVQVLIDGALARFTDVGSIETDPGPHRLVVRHARTSVETPLELAPGVRNRVVEITIAEESHPSSAPMPTKAPVADALDKHATVPVWRWVLGGVGLATLATGGGISISGEVLAGELRSECKPHCSQAQADEVVNRWVIGGTVMAAGSAFFLAAMFWPAESSAAPHASRVAGPRVSMTPSGVTLSGAF